VWGVTELPAEKLQFDVIEELTGRKVKTTVAKYFEDRYNLPLRYFSLTHFYIKSVCFKEKDELQANYQLQKWYSLIMYTYLHFKGVTKNVIY